MEKKETSEVWMQAWIFFKSNKETHKKLENECATDVLPW